MQNRFSRAAADAAGNCSTNAKSRFESDSETIVASSPSKMAADEKRLGKQGSLAENHGMHLFTHHTD